MTRRCFSCSGFTLVELAIVMTIVSLLLAGVMKGAELLDNARANTLVAQARAFDLATTTFTKTYGDLPGDIRSPGTRLPNCGSAPCSTSGDADGAVGLGIGNWDQSNFGGSLTEENRGFWLHLAKANFLAGVIDDTYTGAPNAWGRDFPAHGFGGWHVRYFDRRDFGVTKPYPGYVGHMFTAVADVSSITTRQAFPVKLAAQVDRKTDDGKALTGKVLGVNPGGCFVSESNAIYPETSRNVRCNLYFRASF